MMSSNASVQWPGHGAGLSSRGIQSSGMSVLSFFHQATAMTKKFFSSKSQQGVGVQTTFNNTLTVLNSFEIHLESEYRFVGNYLRSSTQIDQIYIANSTRPTVL